MRGIDVIAHARAPQPPLTPPVIKEIVPFCSPPPLVPGASPTSGPPQTAQRLSPQRTKPAPRRPTNRQISIVSKDPVSQTHLLQSLGKHSLHCDSLCRLSPGEHDCHKRELPALPPLGANTTLMGYPASGHNTLTVRYSRIGGFDSSELMKLDLGMDNGFSGAPLFCSTNGRMLQVVGMASYSIGRTDRVITFSSFSPLLSKALLLQQHQQHLEQPRQQVPHFYLVPADSPQVRESAVKPDDHGHLMPCQTALVASAQVARQPWKRRGAVTGNGNFQKVPYYRCQSLPDFT